MPLTLNEAREANKYCLTCRFWDAPETVPNDLTHTLAGCHRYPPPPAVTGSYTQLQTLASYWCGEYQAGLQYVPGKPPGPSQGPA